MNYEYKYLKYKTKYLNLKKNGGVIEGMGSFGVIYSHPRLPYKEKYTFRRKLIPEDDFSSENIQIKEVSKIFKTENNESNDKLININYFKERNGYLYILRHFTIPNDFFNIPLNYGIVNSELINSKQNIYNKTWASTLNNKQNYVYLDAKYQITFPKGVSIKNNIFHDSIIKFKNIIHAIKYMNDHNLVYDDLKTGNILEVDSKFKISDFSTLTHFSDINYEKYKILNLSVIFYYIFSSLLNNVLYYYLNIKNGKKKNIEEIITKINTNFVENESVVYSRYIYSMSKRIKEFIYDTKLDNSNYLINIHYKKKCINRTNESLNSNHTNKKNINISIDYMFYDILLFYKDNNTKDALYKLYLEEMINYLDKKFGDNINAKINNLLKRINIYSLGITLLEILHSFSEVQKINIRNTEFFNKYKSVLEIIAMTTVNIFKFKNSVYITEPNIDHVIKRYEELFET